jgi:hypothetical protein
MGTRHVDILLWIWPFFCGSGQRRPSLLAFPFLLPLAAVRPRCRSPDHTNAGSFLSGFATALLARSAQRKDVVLASR